MTPTVKKSCLALFAAITLFGIAPAAHAAPRIAIQVGVAVPLAPALVAPALVPPAPPFYGVVYQPGYYAWTGTGYTWVSSAWLRPPDPGAVWVAPQLVRGHWTRGYWRR